MKFYKKILPFITIGATIAVAAPFLTSCGWMANEDYKPTIAQHEAVTFNSLDAAYQEYFSKVEQNNEILIQDYYWSFAQETKALKDKLAKHQYKDVTSQFNIKVTNLQVKHITFNEKTIYLVSGKFNEKTKGSAYTDDGTTKVNYSIQRDTIVELKNMPFVMVYSTEDSISHWQVKYERVQGLDNDWSCRTHGYIDNETTINNKKGSETFNFKNNVDFVYNKDTEPFDYPLVDISSYYFANVKYQA